MHSFAGHGQRFLISYLILQEIKQILKGLSGLKIVGADIVEVAPGARRVLRLYEHKLISFSRSLRL